MKAITVCVEYDDFLRLTVPKNAHHFETMLVVTRARDEGTVQAVHELQEDGHSLRLLFTEAFSGGGADFNKGAAIEEAFGWTGRDRRRGREGWICVLDADVILPREIDWSALEQGNIYSPYRRMLYDPVLLYDGLQWDQLPPGPEEANGEFSGYCQVFHADDPLLETLPWYDPGWRHAGGCDSQFAFRWGDRQRRPDWQVLHLGIPMQNWCGRWTARMDGTFPPDAIHRKERMSAMLRARRTHGLEGERLTRQER